MGRSPERIEQIRTLACVGIPVEHLIARVQHLDSRGKGAFDCMRPTMCPFTTCRMELSSLSRQGSGAVSPLRPLFEYFAEDTPSGHNRVMSRIRALALNLRGTGLVEVHALQGASNDIC